MLSLHHQPQDAAQVYDNSSYLDCNMKVIIKKLDVDIYNIWCAK